jgi:hypothetical protein
MPPYPRERRKFCGKISSDDIAAATVRPENRTVRPAVAMVSRIALAGARGSSCGSRPSSSRKRLITNNA